MNYAELKKVLKKSSIKILIIGLVFSLIGIPMLLAYFLGEKQTAVLVMGIIFTLIGLLMVIKPIKDLGKINSDQHPVLSAIQNKDKSFLIWIYIKQINSKVESVDVGKSFNIVFVTKNNKAIEIVLNKKTSPDKLINYIVSEFPEIMVGFTDENQAAVKERFKK